jgi:hypothetical protein
MNNRWGDFRLPPSDRLLGAEARSFRYAEEQASTDAARWSRADFDDSQWPEVTYSFGPYFWKLGPIPRDMDTAELQKKLAALGQIDPDDPVVVNGRELRWSLCSFSKHFGIERDPYLLHWASGPHGLKGRIPDDFIDLGAQPKDSVWYLWTSLRSPEPRKTHLILGATGEAQAWLNGQPVAEAQGRPPVELTSGDNPLLVRLEPGPGRPLTLGVWPGLRAYAVVGDMLGEPADWEKRVAEKKLHLRWFEKPGAAEYDVFANRDGHIGWYRFKTPPGMQAMTVATRGRPTTCWINGKKADIEQLSQRPDGTTVFRISAVEPSATSAVAAVRLEQMPGYYAGAAIPEPVEFECAEGLAPLGDWCELGLQAYSGTAWYRHKFELDAAYLNKQLVLDLGDLNTTVELRINGRSVGRRFAPPWRFDITDDVQSGTNQIEVLVANTLANHYQIAVPTTWVLPGQTRSGLFGPVTIEARSRVELRNESAD